MAYIAAQGTGAIPTALAQVQPPTGTTANGAAGGQDMLNKANTPNAYAWLLAWGVILAFLTLVNRTRIGHAAIYYGLLLMLFFVIVSNYRFIATSLAPFQTLGQGGQSNGG